MRKPRLPSQSQCGNCGSKFAGGERAVGGGTAVHPPFCAWRLSVFDFAASGFDFGTARLRIEPALFRGARRLGRAAFARNFLRGCDQGGETAARRFAVVRKAARFPCEKRNGISAAKCLKTPFHFVGKRRTAVAVLLTFWPPGPLAERTNSSSSSSSGGRCFRSLSFPGMSAVPFSIPSGRDGRLFHRRRARGRRRVRRPGGRPP